MCSLLLVSSFLSTSRGIAQGYMEQTSSVDSVNILQSMLEEKRNDRLRLERMLGALNSIDSLYKIHYPTWVVIDEDLRQRIFKTFGMRHSNVPQDTTVTIVANPDRSEIVEISIGSAVMGRLESHLNLSDSLHQAILGADYPLRRVDAVPAKERKSVLFGSIPKVVSVDASAFNTELLFSNGWGIEAKIGNDEIGYPFWMTGSARVHAIFNQLRIGVMAPFKFGRKQPDILGPLDIRPRRLNGSTGFSAEFDQPLGSDLVGARLAVGELNKFVSGQLTNDSLPYYLHTVAQLFYSRHASLAGGEHLFTFTGGVGYHQIGLGQVQSDKRITAIKKLNFVSPILRAEYTRHGTRMYGVGVQYYHSIIEVNGWLEFIKNFIYLDLRYSAPIIRGPKPWEQSYFVMISPRFRLAF